MLDYIAIATSIAWTLGPCQGRAETVRLETCGICSAGWFSQPWGFLSDVLPVKSLYTVWGAKSCNLFKVQDTDLWVFPAWPGAFLDSEAWAIGI